MGRKKKNHTRRAVQDSRQGRQTGDPDEEEREPVSSIVDETRSERPLPPQTPRDLSCLHSSSAHAWRSVRRRHRRVASPELPYAPRHSSRIIIPTSIHSMTVPPVLDARPKTYSNATTETTLPGHSNASVQAAPQITERASQTIQPRYADASVQSEPKTIIKKTAPAIPLPQPPPPPVPSLQRPQPPTSSTLNPTSVHNVIANIASQYPSNVAARQDFMFLPVAQRRLLVQLDEFLYPSRGADILLPMNAILSYFDSWREQRAQFVRDSGMVQQWWTDGRGRYWR